MYVATSGRRGGGQGLFARRQFLPGELVSYFGGKKTLEEQFLFENMTLEEEEDAASYYFNLAENAPRWWAVPEGQVIWFQACKSLWWYVHMVNSLGPELFFSTGDRHSSSNAQHKQVPHNAWSQDQLCLL